MKTSETLNRAADMIEERGWAQREGWANEGGPLCLEGGIEAATSITTRRDFIACPAYRAVADYLNYGEKPLYWWNDQRGRTKEEVIEALRGAALVEAAKEEADELAVAVR